MLKIVAACTVLCILIGNGVLGVDQRSAYEKRCSKKLPKPFEGYDVEWLKSVQTWYINHGSRLEMYRQASDVNHKKAEDINEDDLYYHSCFQVKWDAHHHPVVHGFHGKTSETIVKITGPGVYEYNPSHYESGGIGVLTLTDNKTFQFFYKCYDDGEATWIVLSTTDDLDKKTEKIIHDHARSLGFHDKYFTELEFEMCEDSNVQRDEL